MSRTRDEKGKLVSLDCDLCDATMKPGPHVVDSVWVIHGWIDERKLDWW